MVGINPELGGNPGETRGQTGGNPGETRGQTGRSSFFRVTRLSKARVFADHELHSLADLFFPKKKLPPTSMYRRQPARSPRTNRVIAGDGRGRPSLHRQFKAHLKEAPTGTLVRAAMVSQGRSSQNTAFITEVEGSEGWEPGEIPVVPAFVV